MVYMSLIVHCIDGSSLVKTSGPITKPAGSRINQDDATRTTVGKLAREIRLVMSRF